MAEFSSKKIVFAVAPEETSPTWMVQVAQCLVKTQEVYQDFVTYGRSSPTKTWCIGSILVATIIFILWFLRRRIRLLV